MKAKLFRIITIATTLAILGLLAVTALLPLVQVSATTALTLRPNAAGSSTQLVPSAGTNFACEGDNSDITYVSGNVSESKIDLYNVLNHTTESGVISKVDLYIRGLVNSGGGDGTYSDYIMVSGSGGAQGYLNTSVATNSRTLTNSPATGIAWTWAEIDVMQIGIGWDETDGLDTCTVYDVWVVITYLPVATITTSAASNITGVAARLNGNITAVGEDNPTVTVYWGTTDGVTTVGNWQHAVAPTSPAQPQGIAAFYYDVSGLANGTLYYFGAAATNTGGTVWASPTLNFTTKPAAPTNVSATDGTYGDKVVITWTKSTGATGYRVYRDAGLIATLGDVATHNDTGAGVPVVTEGVATASEGTSSSYVTLTVTGMSIASGATSSYYVIATNAAGDSPASSANDGYRRGNLTYQWKVSAADSDLTFSNIGTTNPYNYSSAPAATVPVTTGVFGGFGVDWAILRGSIGTGSVVGRYYYCVVSADGTASEDTNHDRGYRSVGTVTQIGFNYGLTSGYGTSWTNTITVVAGGSFAGTIQSLTAATTYHWQAKAYDGSTWYYGGDSYVTTVGSPVKYEYKTTTGDTNSQPIYAGNYSTESFTVGATSHTITEIVLELKRVGTTPGDVIIELYHADISGNPTGLTIESATYDGDVLSTSYSMLEFSIDETSVTALQPYAIVVSAPLGGVADYILWHRVAAGGLADAVASYSTDGGITWTPEANAQYLFEIWGNPCIDVVSGLAYRNYIETGDILFLLEYVNIYPPYYDPPQQKPSQYFTIRLYDTNGTTLLASTPMLQWGNRPGSLYLNADQAASITIGGAYYMAVYGTFTGNPVDMYPLAVTDWSGDIGEWVIATAYNMALYYNVDFTTFLVDGGEVLAGTNNEGIAMFVTGVPYLMETHPELFVVVSETPHFVAPTAPPNLNFNTWQGQVGSIIATFFNTFGGMLGISGKFIGTFLLLALYFAMAASIGTKGGSPLIALAIGFPLVGIGVFAMFIDYAIIGVIMIVAWAITLIGFWWMRT